MPVRLSPCPACRSGRVGEAFEAGGVNWLACRDCRSLFDAAPPRPEELRRLYDGAEYFVKPAGGEGESLWGYPADYLADRAASEAKFERVLGHLERYAGPGRLLDVGAGPGFLVAVAERRGWQAAGVDLNPWAVERGREEGLDVRAGDLAGLGLPDGELDALTMLDLIEHVPDGDALVGEAARVVRPEGAIAILTPDAGSPASRALGRRWPEVRRPGEHTVLYSVRGLTALLARHGFAAAGWHSVGKTASLETLAADVSPAAPGLAERARKTLARTALGRRQVEFDPRTKFCLYARRLPAGARLPAHKPARVPRRPQELDSVEGAIADELAELAAARRYRDWVFAGFADHVRGDVAEVGAGIGTFSELILARGPDSLLLIEPEESCAVALERAVGADPRVTISPETLPQAPALRPGGFDLVVCQNVLEHVADDSAALARMAGALRPGGRLALAVPAGSDLFGPLDDAYGHWRRYERGELGRVVAAAGLEVEVLRPMNALGIPGWRAKNLRPGARIGGSSLAVYEQLVRVWRPLEERVRPGRGLSLFCLAARPTVSRRSRPAAA